MQRKRSFPSAGPSRPVVLALVVLVLFLAAVGASCAVNPHLYTGQGYVIFVPASASAPAPAVLSPF